MQAYLATRISPHLARTADGFLIARDVVVARSGPLEYLASELDLPGGAQRVTVWRPPEEITNRRFLASCEGATVTDQHPGRFVDPGNYQVYARGHMQNARVGPMDANGNATAIADLFINDDGLAQRVETGAVRDVSIGYNLDVVKDEIGRWSQVNLRVNHVAVVPVGRAGSTRIMDAAPGRGLTELAALYLGREVTSVRVPEHAATRAFDSREEVMAENKWKCSCGNVNHADAEDCAACGAAYDEQDDLVPVEQELPERKITKDEALHWLEQIKPQVKRRGTDAAKRAWNRFYSLVRDGRNPELALENVRGQFSASGRVTASDRAPGSAEFVSTCASYLGKMSRKLLGKGKSVRRFAQQRCCEGQVLRFSE